MLPYGERMRKIRKHLGWTQAQAAQHFGIRQNMISRYERGEHQVPDEIKMELHKLGINLNWFISGEGSMVNDIQTSQELATLKKEVASLEVNVTQVQAESTALAHWVSSIKGLI